MTAQNPPPDIITQLPSLAPRAADSNKGDFGRVLIVAGSRGMSGAAILCGKAALRGGAGLVKVAVPHEILPTVAAGDPCYMTVPLSQDGTGLLDFPALAEIFAMEQTQTVLAVGPGLGRGTELSRMLPELVGKASRPLVLDADGLNAFAGQAGKLHTAGVPLIITPHPGEMGRLLVVATHVVQSRREEMAVRCAREHRLIVVLKGHGTIVTDGQRLYRNTTGNPGMSTGGTGDVLTGLIAALVGQGLEPFAAAQLGVYLHGRAGDLARERVGEVSLIATDLLDFLPAAIRQLQTAASSSQPEETA
jgi:ADP-dependent NAD(P)H-hydrate dehydratase